MTSWKDRKRGHWRYRFQHKGEYYYGKGYTTRRESDAAEAEQRRMIKTAQKPPTPAGMGFVYLVNSYLDYAVRKFATKTYKYKKFVYQGFIDQYGDIAVDEITPLHIYDYLNTLKSNNLYNVHRKDLSALFSYAKKQLKVSAPNPCNDVEKMPHSAKPKDIPSEDEVRRLNAAATPGDERDTIVCCLHLLGRIDEILRMTWQDVNFEKRIVILWTRKRKGGAYEPDPMPMNIDLHDCLKRRWDNRKQDKWVFWNEKANEGKGDRFMHRPKMMDSLCKRAGCKPIGTRRVKMRPSMVRTIEKKTKKKLKDDEKYLIKPRYYGFASLRHFVASYMADTGVGTQAIQKCLRHKQLRTTEIYLHSLDESQRMAIESIEGKFTPQKENPLTVPSHSQKKGVTGGP